MVIIRNENITGSKNVTKDTNYLLLAIPSTSPSELQITRHLASIVRATTGVGTTVVLYQGSRESEFW
jgi:hypothetical protein